MNCCDKQIRTAIIVPLHQCRNKNSEYCFHFAMHILDKLPRPKNRPISSWPRAVKTNVIKSVLSQREGRRDLSICALTEKSGMSLR